MQKRTNINIDNFLPVSDHILFDLISQWHRYLIVECGYSIHTERAYSADLLVFFQFMCHHLVLENITIEVLDTLKLQEFRSWLASLRQNGRSPSSTYRALSSIRHFFKYIKTQFGFKENNGLASVKLRTSAKRLPRSLKESTAIDAIKFIPNISKKNWIKLRDQAILLLLYGTGLRISEALDLTIGDLILSLDDLSQENKIIVKTKKRGYERELPLLPIISQVIKEYIKNCPYLLNYYSNNCSYTSTSKIKKVKKSSVSTETQGVFLFYGSRGSKLNPDVFRAQLRRLRKEFNLPSQISPHAFRHTFATCLLESNMDLRSIQELLGHSTLTSTQYYTNVGYKRLYEEYLKYQPRDNLK